MNLKEIELALSKLTQGPWVVIEDEDKAGYSHFSICSMMGNHVETCPTEEPYKSAHCHECVVWETYIRKEDAEFIAKAPDYIRWLLKKVKTLTNKN